MARLPISIDKFKTGKGNESKVRYLLTINESKTNWQLTHQCSREDLLNFRDRINEILDDTNTAELLEVSTKEAEKIDTFHKTDALCSDCTMKMTKSCITCLFTLQSPLERKLYKELSNTYIRFTPQYPIDRNGYNINDYQFNIIKNTNNYKGVLTISDFYVENRGVKLCIYTDGHTYHERTEEQAQRDRNIDRKLQELGYQVLRYTGKEVNENSGKIIEDIKKWTGYK